MGSAKKLWEELNSDRIDAYQAKYREKHGDAIRARNRKRAQRPDVQAYDKSRSKARREKHKQVLVERLGGCCAHCGTTENLEFDHKHPGEKEYSVTARIMCNLESLYPETDKCQLLCASCHKTITSKQKEIAWRLFTSLTPELMDAIMNNEIDINDIVITTNQDSH